MTILSIKPGELMLFWSMVRSTAYRFPEATVLEIKQMKWRYRQETMKKTRKFNQKRKSISDISPVYQNPAEGLFPGPENSRYIDSLIIIPAIEYFSFYAA